MLTNGVRTWIRGMIRFLVVVAAGWVILVALLWLVQRRLIYLPDTRLPAPPAEVEVVVTETTDEIEHRVWLIPAGGEPTARVVVFNGNAGNKSHRLPLARDLAAAGMEVMLFDYRGYGETEGSPSEEGLLRDAIAVTDVAFGADVPVVYFGESTGAAVAVAIAGVRPPDALILRSPFTSLVDLARIHYRIVPAGLLLRDRFEVAEQISQLDVPVLVILGTEDSIVPPRLSRRVFEAAAGPKELVELEGLGHNDPGLTSGEEPIRATARFLRRTLP